MTHSNTVDSFNFERLVDKHVLLSVFDNSAKLKLKDSTVISMVIIDYVCGRNRYIVPVVCVFVGMCILQLSFFYRWDGEQYKLGGIPVTRLSRYLTWSIHCLCSL